MISKEILDKFIGLMERDAIHLAGKHGLDYRTVSRDGIKYQIDPDNFNIDRVNLHIENVRVCNATLG